MPELLDRLLLPMLTLLVASLFGAICAGLAARWIDRRILPVLAFAVAAAGFALSAFAPPAPFFEYGVQSLLFDTGSYGLMFAAGGIGWCVTGKWLAASLFSLGASVALAIVSPLWQLALACGLLGSCP